MGLLLFILACVFLDDYNRLNKRVNKLETNVKHHTNR